MSKIIIERLLKMNIDRQTMIKNGFTAQKYDDILRGKSNYKLDDIIKISEKFQLSLDYLILGKEKSSSSELSEEEQRCLKAFNDLLPNDKIDFVARMEQRYVDYPPELKESV